MNRKQFYSHQLVLNRLRSLCWNGLRWVPVCFLLMGLPCLLGCPDYSHLRQPPDYANMSDGGATTESEE